MTEIKITPFGEGTETETIVYYDSCVVNGSITERTGSFSITLPFKKDQDISKYTIGADVRINQDGHKFRGYVTNPPKKSNYLVKSVTLEGADYTARTQKVLVFESYTDVEVSAVVTDLFTKYASWVNLSKIQTNAKKLTIKFTDTYLWDVMEQICELTGYEWYIDDELAINFFQTANAINPNTLTPDKYIRGSAEFTETADKLVNKLWVKGANAISLPYTQNITVTTGTPISLHYKPRVTDGEVITITIGGVQKTVGIQYIDDTGTKDFIINTNEKLLIPDLCTTGSGTITYRYEYPLRILLENEASKSQYGLYEGIINVTTNDKAIAKEIGINYLDKFSKPMICGSIEPLDGIYNVGELIKVEIPSLDLNDYLVIKDVTYESINQIGKVRRKITLESTQRDIASILKDLNKRLNKLEVALFGTSDDVLVEKYKVYGDDIQLPGLEDSCIYVLHQYHITGTNIYCSGGLLI